MNITINKTGGQTTITIDKSLDNATIERMLQAIANEKSTDK